MDGVDTPQTVMTTMQSTCGAKNLFIKKFHKTVIPRLLGVFTIDMKSHKNSNQKEIGICRSQTAIDCYQSEGGSLKGPHPALQHSSARFCKARIYFSARPVFIFLQGQFLFFCKASIYFSAKPVFSPCSSHNKGILPPGRNYSI